MNVTHHTPGDEALPADVGAEDPFDRLAGDDADDTAIEATEQSVEGRAGVAIEWSEEQLCDWVDRVVDHDERALAALYDATLSRVYGLVLRIVRRASLAEEVVEDTYFQVWRQAARFDASRGRVLTWLLGMARSRAIDALRHEARFRHEPLGGDDAHEAADDTTPSDELLDIARGHAELQRALMQLNAQPRQLVALAFFRGLSHEEIACETALPLGTVKSQIRRALAALRLHIGEGGPRGLAS
ncbi:sigma-70 family RNA polymerase sigma factor [Variovorax sp. YR752]|uniref:sigma-70 family RNA polymerase sigma factor n=1 Tax=Variovorax sp. YR752 TaxID=1884383 RepID=UPI003137C52F